MYAIRSYYEHVGRTLIQLQMHLAADDAHLPQRMARITSYNVCYTKLLRLAVGAILKNGSEVAVNSGDRVVVQNPDGSYRVIKDDNALLRQPGTTLSTQNYAVV